MASRPVPPLWSSLSLDRAAAPSLQDQIVDFFRAAVLAGRLAPGTRVPSSRQLAADHGVARITAVEAYDRLVAEGYLRARAGAGLFVADGLPEPAAPPPVTRAGAPAPPAAARVRRLMAPPARPTEILALSAGLPALDQFPWRDWGRISARLHRERPATALAYGDPRGAPALRAAIAEHLGVARGIACSPEQVLVVAGSQQGIDLTARVLAEPGDAVWVEEPGYPIGRAAFEAAGLRPISVPVDSEGLDVAAGITAARHARLAFVAPSHQYPLGATLSLRRRLALLEWAAAEDAWVLEDDYDGDYRYGGRPLAPLHTLDRTGRVIYLGTFSKVLAPGLRLGYLVVPPTLIEPFAVRKAVADRHAPGLDQQILARFIAEGRLAAHLRRMRVLYSRRRAALIDALADEAAGLLDVGMAPEAGLHLAVRLTIEADDVAVSGAALEARVHAAALSTYYAGPVRGRGFVLGFACTPEEQIRPAVRSLDQAIETVAKRPARDR
jgi:GntR family transcriptional regulator/MocR family aminotransferase